MIIYLVRHVAYENPGVFAYRLPFPLSIEGRQHAARIGQWFVEQKALGITVYSSPVVRAVQTAEIIAAHTQSFVAIDPLLIETQCDIEGMAKPKEGFHEMEHNPSIREFPGTIQERMRQSFKERAAHGRDCVLVSHGDPLTLLYHHLCEKPLIIDFYRAEDYIVQGEIVRVLFENNRVTELSRFTV